MSMLGGSTELRVGSLYAPPNRTLRSLSLLVPCLWLVSWSHSVQWGVFVVSQFKLIGPIGIVVSA